MATPLVNKRYNLGDGVLHLEMLPTPNIFLDGDYNTNTELVWDFFSTFISSTFGAIKTAGYTVTISGNDISVTTGTIWYDRFYLNKTVSTAFENGRNVGTTQYLYAKITHTRLDITDDAVSETDVNLAKIRQQVNGSDVSRPNQYTYTYELLMFSADQIDVTGNLPTGDDIYYLKIATIDTAEAVTYDLRSFGDVLSTDQIPANIGTTVGTNTTNITALQVESPLNAKRNADNTFLGTNTLTSNSTAYDSGTSTITLGVGNIGTLSINGSFNVTALSDKPSGTIFKLKVSGTGSLTFINSSSLVCPGDNNLIVTAGNWIEFGKTSANTWEITSNSTANTVSITTSGRIPVGAITNFEGSLSEFDGTGLGNAVNTAGWAICNGNNSTPDLRGKSVITMSDSDGDYSVSGNTGGAKKITLSISQLPAHSFTVTGTTDTTGDHTHTATSNGSVNDTGGGTAVAGNTGTQDLSQLTLSTEGDHAHTITGTTNSLGSGAEIDIRSPYYVLATIKRIA